MPLIKIHTSGALPDDEKISALLTDLSALLARRFEKPESYVMTCLAQPARMTFGGTFEPACYAEVKNIGTMSPALTKTLSADICDRLSAALGVAKDRIYIEFNDAKAHLWGYDGSTFA
jgi:phenylpyruvate tautomerase PptA (4-oxalocrotonate tautomerase family)